MSELRLPGLSAAPFRLLRAGLQWLRRPGDPLSAREPVAVCHARIVGGPPDHQGPHPLSDERYDLQVVLATREAGVLGAEVNESKGGYADFLGNADWRGGMPIGTIDSAGDGSLVAMGLAGRRVFESGEGRGGLLAGLHDRVRGFWEGASPDAAQTFGSILALGHCEHTSVFRGDDMAFLSWFALAPGPAQIVAVADERCVHSSAVLLQQLRRTPAEAHAITDAVHSWLSERMSGALPNVLMGPNAAVGIPPSASRREIQDMLFALNLLGESVGPSPILEQTDALTRRGLVRVGPPNAIALSLGSEFAPHFRHRRTGWLVSFHTFRFGTYFGAGFNEWLRRDFERVQRSVADIERDLAALAAEVRARTGAVLLVNNVIASSPTDRISNYSWLGDAFEQSIAVINTEANMMLSGLTQTANISMIDADALAAELGTRHCPDRAHPSRELAHAQRREIQRVLRERCVPGF